MKKIYLLTLLTFFLLLSLPLYAPWIWTPETGWMNEKDIVKESPKAQWDYAQELVKKGEHNNAVRAYKALVKAYPASPLAPQALQKAAECYEHEGMLYEAFKEYQTLLENYPKETDLEDILKRQYRIGELFIKGKKRKLWRFPIIPAADKGIEILEAIVKNAPYGEISPQAQFNIGTAYKRMGKYTEAIEAYNKVVTDYKDTPLYEEALYQVGWCNYKKSRGFSYDQLAAKEAVKWFQRFKEEFPQSKHMQRIDKLLDELSGRQAKGIFEIARFYEKHGHKSAAIMYYKEVIEKSPGTKEAKEAEERLQKLEK